ncbi:MAG: radical SAM protein [Candidatus Omnitrophica bacterium]|nr:radical SAM protein [Candidatus Omnitrophota bacterium]
MALDQLILFTTSACNLSCPGCFFVSELNSKDDMTLERIETLAHSSGELKSALLTGGEPFLRKDIDRIIELFLERCHVDVNTNGFFPLKIKDIITSILSKRPSHTLTISVSIDGFEAAHNKRRENDRSFIKAVDTLRLLTALRKRYRGFSVKINTVISPDNLDELVDFAKEFAIGFSPDYHNFEIERQNPDSAKRLIQRRDKLLNVYEELLRVIYKRYPSSYLIDRQRFKMQFANITDGKHWGFPCLAGIKSVVVYPNGILSACEMRPKRIKLSDFGYDLSAALASKPMSQEISQIETDQCFCTHGCWLLISMRDWLAKGYKTDDYKRILLNLFKEATIKEQFDLATAFFRERMRRVCR